MTLQEAERRKKEIHHAAYEEDDDEAATSIERKLWRDTLHSIAKRTCDNPQAVAATVVETAKWTFRRI